MSEARTRHSFHSRAQVLLGPRPGQHLLFAGASVELAIVVGAGLVAATFSTVDTELAQILGSGWLSRWLSYIAQATVAALPLALALYLVARHFLGSRRRPVFEGLLFASCALIVALLCTVVVVAIGPDGASVGLVVAAVGAWIGLLSPPLLAVLLRRPATGRWVVGLVGVIAIVAITGSFAASWI